MKGIEVFANTESFAEAANALREALEVSGIELNVYGTNANINITINTCESRKKDPPSHPDPK